MILFHAGVSEIRKPDIHYGRKNADFGQGFYLSPEKEFSCRLTVEREETEFQTQFAEKMQSFE